jgi:mannitol-1-phosphate 5-dehydrogenase
MHTGKKIVIFGAGKIGRSFIGQLFSRGGFEVVFVDVFKPVVDALNEKQSYKVVIKAEKDEILMIQNVRAVLASETEKVVDELVTADIAAVSTGQQGFPLALQLLATGLLKRQQVSGGNPLDIIIAENLRDAANYFGTELKRLLPQGFPLNKLRFG